MSFNFPETNTATTATPVNGRAKESKTTLGYLNLYVPLADGTRIKVGNAVTICLFEEYAGEKAFVDLVKSGKINEAQLASMVQVEFNLARDKNAEIVFDTTQFDI